jgi:lipoyl-dependent peroxiredoxin
MAVEQRASCVWTGTLTEGEGRVSAESSGLFADAPVTWKARSEEAGTTTSPEELLAAAHAACFAMSLAGELAGAGSAPDQLDVRATVTLDQVEDGSHRIVSSELLARARVTEMDGPTLQRLAASASEGCPFTKLIEASGTVTVNATLEGEDDGD